jgi:hypothetical protein
MWEDKSSGAVNVRKNEFIESINLRWKNRISARNGVYEIKKLHVSKLFTCFLAYKTYISAETAHAFN